MSLQLLYVSTVSEASGIPDPLDPTFPHDPNDYTEGTNDLNIVFDLISEDLLSGEGVPTLP